MAKRVFLHVGTPESGTTYLQAVLWQNADALKRNGLLLPARFSVHDAAAKEVTTRTGLKSELDVDVEQAWGAYESELRLPVWRKVARRVRTMGQRLAGRASA